MFAQRNRLGVLALALSASAGTMAQAAAPLPGAASAQQSAPAPRTAPSPTNRPPTTAQLNQPGAIVIAPPILRNEGKTVATPDRPILTQLNFHTQSLRGAVIAPPPAIPPAPIEAAINTAAAHN
jgi:hypothetical protein